MPTTAYVGLGSNLGDRLGNVSAAVDAIAHLPQTHVENVSHAYESAAAYNEDQPTFINAVVEVSTGLAADAFMEYLLEIESKMGRVRDAENGPRVIDLDLLLFGDEEWDSPALTVPHPGLAKRDFVVTPLLEIAPRTTLPDGTALRRSEATIGPVLSDLGPLPDAGEQHNVPVEEVEWVVVAESESAADTQAGFDAGLQLKQEVLEAEGIPFAYAPYEPGADLDTFGMQTAFQLMVPAGYAETARALLALVDAAPLEYPPGYVPDEE